MLQYLEEAALAKQLNYVRNTLGFNAVMNLEAATKFSSKHQKIGVYQHPDKKLYFFVTSYGEYPKEFHGFFLHVKNVPQNLSRLVLKKLSVWKRLGSNEALARFLLTEKTAELSQTVTNVQGE
jgi:hypothetical protein